jgi:hypothetical protein
MLGFLIYFVKISANKLSFLTHNKAKLRKILTTTLVFEKNANFFAEKLLKIAENCDHNIRHQIFLGTTLATTDHNIGPGHEGLLRTQFA